MLYFSILFYNMGRLTQSSLSFDIGKKSKNVLLNTTQDQWRIQDLEKGEAKPAQGAPPLP